MNFSLLIALLLIAMSAAATVPVCDVTPDENGHFNSPFRNCAITDPEDACIGQDQDGNLIAEGNNRLTTPIMISQGGNIKGDVNGDGEVNIADVNAIINIILNPAPADDHEWVDLGLPSGTLWATCNVGASVPEQYGDYFAWGETTPKEYYDFSTYKWCNGTWNSLTKYCSDSFWGTVDNKRELDSEDDAASANWGSSWRMPSADQMKELCRSCTWQWIQRNGVNGQQVTGPNGNNIFLPVAGLRGEGSLLQAGVSGYYWSRTVNTADPDGACCLFFDSNSMDDAGSGNRIAGFSVRAVRVLFH